MIALTNSLPSLKKPEASNENNTSITPMMITPAEADKEFIGYMKQVLKDAAPE